MRQDVDEFGRLLNPHIKRQKDFYDVLQVARYERVFTLFWIKKTYNFDLEIFNSLNKSAVQLLKTIQKSNQKATDEEIKHSHRNLVKIFHPDSPNGNEEFFLEIQAAFETLSDPTKRKAYNEERRKLEARILPTMAHQENGIVLI